MAEGRWGRGQGGENVCVCVCVWRGGGFKGPSFHKLLELTEGNSSSLAPQFHSRCTCTIVEIGLKQLRWTGPPRCGKPIEQQPTKRHSTRCLGLSIKGLFTPRPLREGDNSHWVIQVIGCPIHTGQSLLLFLAS